MKKWYVLFFSLSCNILFAQTDTTQTLDEVNINAIRAKSNPSNILLNKKEIDANNTGRDLPYLLNRTPSAVITSDAGNGFGYTGIRIRGVDASRINVTINGVPINDAESHGMYWVDLPDFASSAGSIQVQRGVGTSTNGNAAFGGSINLRTLDQSNRAYSNMSGSWGYIEPEKRGFEQAPKNRFSNRYNINFGSGKINNWTVDGRLSMIHSDGYVLRSAANLKSYYLQAVYSKNNDLLKLVHFSGKEVTGQAWNGVPENILYGDKLNNIAPNRIYNDFNYINQTDNYQQNYYQVFYTRKLSNCMLNTAIYYTKGLGYYEEYKKDQGLSFYGIKADSPITNSDLIRRRWLNNDYYGGMVNAQFKHLLLGLFVSEYKGKNYGEVIWARYAGNSEIGQKYYDGKSNKKEASFSAKYYNKISSILDYFLDMQYRVIDYSLKGNDDNYGTQVNYDHHLNYYFFNPKLGLNYELNKKNKLNIYYGVSHREPVRSDIIVASNKSIPLPESMQDFELGWNYNTKKLNLNTNLYYMYYINQLVNDGSINDVGAYNRVNVPVSYRTGIEIEATYQLSKQFSLYGNITLSQNKIKDYHEYLDFYDTAWNKIANKEYKTYALTNIAFSPAVTGFIQIKYSPVKNLVLGVSTKYISRQYLDNSQNKSQSINPSTIIDFQVNYSLKTKFFQQIDFVLLANNVGNTAYTTNGYGYYTYIMGTDRKFTNYFYPNALRNYLLQVKFSL